MPNNAARNFARCDRGLVVAAAGCGKTHLVAEAAGHVNGKQLVLTHTHAGVYALRKKLTDVGVPPGKCYITTIDSLALCYSNAFPHLAGWDCDYPSTDYEWKALREAASRLFGCRAPRRVLRASFVGMFVDEYQDCCGSQHAMIEALAQVLPCRIVGDPLQAIYRKLHKNDIVRWSEVEQVFPVVDELKEPHRWRKRNSELGDWLANVRIHLMNGSGVDFNNARRIIKWIQLADDKNKIASCKGAYRKESVVAICDWEDRCANIASRTRNNFVVLETVECPDLLQWADNIGNSIGLNRLEYVVNFAQQCLTGMTVLNDLINRMKKGITYNPRSPDKAHLWNKMQVMAGSDDLYAAEDMMSAIEGISDEHFYKRKELWRDMRRTLRNYDTKSGKCLRESAWALRDHARRNGRRLLSKRIIATPLRIKGLEFDHALLLDAEQMQSAEELYVALTRGSFSLTVLSSKPIVTHQIPFFRKENSSENESIQ